MDIFISITMCFNFTYNISLFTYKIISKLPTYAQILIPYILVFFLFISMDKTGVDNYVNK